MDGMAGSIADKTNGCQMDMTVGIQDEKIEMLKKNRTELCTVLWCKHRQVIEFNELTYGRNEKKLTAGWLWEGS